MKDPSAHVQFPICTATDCFWMRYGRDFSSTIAIASRTLLPKYSKKARDFRPITPMVSTATGLKVCYLVEVKIFAFLTLLCLGNHCTPLIGGICDMDDVST